MKTNILSIILFCSFLFVFENLYGEGITISKGQGVPNEVCNVTSYAYTAALSGLDPNKTYYVSWKPTNASVEASSLSGATVKWQASTTLQTGNIGKIYAELQDVNQKPIATSNTIEVTIKSIKHLKAEIPMYTYNGGVLTIDPCSSNTIYMSAANMSVPGTGVNPERVVDFKWLVPSGWKVDGQTSNGSSVILAGQNVTVMYPASTTEGTLSVKGYHVVLNCTAELQESVSSDAISVKRDVNFTLSANKTNLLCGDTSPVTFTVTPALPCAVYYWNNSQTPTTSNSFQITPNGLTNVTATVNIVYGGKTKPMSKTINNLLFPPGIVPEIQGSLSLCGNNESYTISNLRSGYSVSWNCSSNLSRVSPQVSYPGIFNYNAAGSGWIEATITTPCGIYPTVLHIVVQAGITASFTGNTTVLFEGSGTWTGSATCGTAPFNYEWFLREVNGSGAEAILIGEGNPLTLWSVPRSLKATGNETVSSVPIIMQPITHTDYYLQLRAYDANNMLFITPEKLVVANGDVDLINPVAKMQIATDENVSALQLIVSPNPASDEASLEINDTSGQIMVTNTEWQIEVYDAMQSLKAKVQKLKGRQYSISTSGWKDGVYIVRAKIGDQIITNKLVVKH